MFNTLTRIGSSGVTDSYEIEKSLRFNDADSPRLDRAISGAGNRRTWTFSCWFKRTSTNTDENIFMQGDAGSQRGGLMIVGQQLLWLDTTGSPDCNLTTTALLRDPTAWYHVVLQYDTTQGTDTNRHKMYLNGSIPTFSTSTYQTQNTDGYISSTTSGMRIGANPYNTSLSKFDGYLAEMHFIDGSTVPVSTFGETNSNGKWVPKEVTGVTYGTNGFYLDFKDSSSLGNDAAGSNNFTPTNLSSASDFIANDLFADSPTANYATLNPLQGRGLDSGESGTLPTFTQGNLHVSGGQTNDRIRGTIGLKLGVAGKYYFEVKAIGTPGSSNCIGFQDEYSKPSTQVADYLAHWSFNSGNDLPYKESGSNPGWTAGDILGVAINTGTSKVTWYKNNTSAGVSDLSSSSMEYIFPFIGANSGIAFAANFGGNGSFNYTPPADHVPITVQNLSDPTIADPTEHFNTVLYTGNNGTQSITGVGFQPDLVWIKDRESASPGHIVTDAVRGAGKAFFPNNNAQEDTNAAAGYLSAFGSDGFTVTDGSGSAARVNSSNDFFSLNWKAGGSASSNGNGTLTSSVSVNATAGFSIATYTGDNAGGNSTVGHGLGVAPEVVLIKRRDSSGDWIVGHDGLATNAFTNTKFLKLHDNAAVFTNSLVWGAQPTSTVVQITTGSGASNLNASGGTYAMYSFVSVAGYSKFGSYLGNANADGPFVYTGFKPAFMIAKNSATTNYWRMWNNKSAPVNPVATGQYPNDPAVEDAPVNWTVDWLSNGFKVRNDDSEMNGSGNIIIYMAFAEAPFKTF